MDDNGNAKTEWFVLRDLKRANAKLRAYQWLSEMGFEVFTPLVTKLATRHGRRIRLTVPAISDMLFVHSTRELLDPVIAKTDTLQYRYLKGGAYQQPMVVRDDDMARFIAATQCSDGPIYYTPDEITPDMLGRKVMIIGGPMDGYEAILVKTRGTRKRRVFVEIPTLLAVSTEILPEYIQPLP